MRMPSLNVMICGLAVLGIVRALREAPTAQSDRHGDAAG